MGPNQNQLCFKYAVLNLPPELVKFSHKWKAKQKKQKTNKQKTTKNKLKIKLGGSSTEHLKGLCLNLYWFYLVRLTVGSKVSASELSLACINYYIKPLCMVKTKKGFR